MAAAAAGREHALTEWRLQQLADGKVYPHPYLSLPRYSLIWTRNFVRTRATPRYGRGGLGTAGRSYLCGDHVHPKGSLASGGHVYFSLSCRSTPTHGFPPAIPPSSSYIHIVDTRAKTRLYNHVNIPSTLTATQVKCRTLESDFPDRPPYTITITLGYPIIISNRRPYRKPWWVIRIF